MSIRVAYCIGGSARIVTLNMEPGASMNDVAERISVQRKVPIQRVYIMRARAV